MATCEYCGDELDPDDHYIDANFEEYYRFCTKSHHTAWMDAGGP